MCVQNVVFRGIVKVLCVREILSLHEDQEW